MSDTHRLSVYKRSRLLGDRRTIPIYGEGDDANKLFKCWNCGAICNIERESLSQEEHSASGIGILDAPEFSLGPNNYLSEPLNTIAILDDMHTILENGPDGNPIVRYKHNQYPYVYAGCWNCGSRNYK